MFVNYDPVLFEYGALCILSGWSLALCVDHLVKKEKLSPFFYYVIMLLVGLFINYLFNFKARLDIFADDDAWTKYPNRMKSIWWFLRAVPVLVPIAFVSVDFTMRRFWGVRLFDKFYKNGVSEEDS